MQKQALRIAIIAALAFQSVSYAIKIENLPFMSDAHIGVVSGVGAGLGIGFDAGFGFMNFKIGPEIEQVITDANYSSTINATRFGGFLSYRISESFCLNIHAGGFNFQPNRDTFYSAGGTNYILLESTDYKGQYTGVSVDYFLSPNFMVSPKILVNTITDQGTLNEFDLNLGFSF